MSESEEETFLELNFYQLSSRGIIRVSSIDIDNYQWHLNGLIIEVEKMSRITSTIDKRENRRAFEEVFSYKLEKCFDVACRHL